MRLLVVYRPNSEHGRDVEAFIRDFKYQHAINSNFLEAVDVDTRDGAATASLYDIMQYPAVLALTDDGQVMKTWEGGNMPLMNEVAGYVYTA